MYSFLVGIYTCRVRESYQMKSSQYFQMEEESSQQYRFYLVIGEKKKEWLLMAFPHISGFFSSRMLNKLWAILLHIHHSHIRLLSKSSPK